MSTTTPKKDPLSSLFGQGPTPAEPGLVIEPSDMPEPAHVRALKPVSRPMPPPLLPPSPSAGPDPRALAKMLAKAAVAKAGPPAADPAYKAEPKPKAEPKAEPKPAVRGVAAAPPPVRKLSALEAMDLARKQESDKAMPAPVPSAPAFSPPPFSPTPSPPPPVIAALPPAPKTAARFTTPSPDASGANAPGAAASIPEITDDQLGDLVQAALGTGLPGAQIYVANAMFADDRKTLSALWRSHRARFLATHQVEYAVGASLVLWHMHNSPPRQLAAAHAVTDKGELLLWVDLGQRIVLTAFANPRQLVEGW